MSASPHDQPRCCVCRRIERPDLPLLPASDIPPADNTTPQVDPPWCCTPCWRKYPANRDGRECRGK